MVMGVIIIALGPFIQFFDGHFAQKVLKYKQERNNKKGVGLRMEAHAFTITIRT